MSKEFMNAPIEDDSVVEQKKENNTKLGVVTECGYLRVRSTPEVKDNNVITKIKIADEVIVDIDKSTDEFYHVTTESGVEGFCMKKFINIGM